MTEIGFHDEDAADEEENQFLADDDGDVADQAAERERAGVAHEDGGGVAVEPEEAEAGAHHAAGEDGHLVGRLDVGELAAWRPRLCVPTIRARMQKVKLTMAMQPAARPSRPSVRLTALLEPVMTTVAIRMIDAEVESQAG